MIQPKRDSNMQLLRIAAMCMVILHHLTWHGFYHQLAAYPEAFHYPVFFQRLLIVETFLPMGKTADAIFLLISGYYLVERGAGVSLSRSAKKLISQVAFASVLLVVCSTGYYFLHKEAEVGLEDIIQFNSGWWFVGYYFCVIVIGGLWLNGFLMKLSRKQYSEFLLLVFGAFSLSWAGSLLDSLAAGLRTLIAGLWLYSMGGYIKKFNPFRHLRFWMLPAGFVLVYLLVWLSYYNASINNIQKYLQTDQQLRYIQVRRLYEDYSIVPISLGLLLFEMARRIRLPYSRVIDWLGGASFMVYLIHDNDFVRWIWRERDLTALMQNSPLQFLLWCMKTVVVVYGIGCAAYLLYQAVMKLIAGSRKQAAVSEP